MGIVIPLFEKGNIGNCSNYREINLLSVVLKVYERIMRKKVRCISDKQWIQKRRSYQDHIFTLKQISEKIRVRDQKIYMAFIDILEVFDNVTRKHI